MTTNNTIIEGRKQLRVQLTPGGPVRHKTIRTLELIPGLDWIRAHSPNEGMIEAKAFLTAAAGGDGQTVKLKGVAQDGDSMQVSGFSYPVVLDLPKMKVSANVPLMADHSSAIGDRLGTCSARVEGGRLWVEANVVGGTPAADRVIQLARNGGVSLSVGIMPTDMTFIRKGESVTVNGRTFDGPLQLVTQGELKEISAVGVGANSGAAAIAANAPAVRTNSPTNGDTGDAAKAERARCRGIYAAFASISGGREEADRMIEAGNSIEEAWQRAVTMMRAERPKGPAVHVAQDVLAGVDDRSLECAFTIQSLGMEVAKRCYGEAIAAKAEAIHRSAPSMYDLVCAVLKAKGHTLRHDRDSNIRAAFSTNELATILNSTMNTIAMDTYRRAGEAWRTFAKPITMADFKQFQAVNLAGNIQFQQLPPGGQLKHGTLDGESTTLAGDTFGLMLSIDRRDIINGNDAILSQIPVELGLEGARKVGDAMATLLDDAGGTFFTTARGNKLTGTTSVFGPDAVTLAVRGLREMEDTSGRRLNIAPAVLLVGPDLEMAARQLLNSAEIRDTTADTKFGTSNPLAGIARLEVDGRVNEGEWFLFGSPSMGAALVATLDGRDAPIVETADADFDRLGIQWRGYHDFAVALHQWRAVIKSLGQ